MLISSAAAVLYNLSSSWSSSVISQSSSESLLPALFVQKGSRVFTSSWKRSRPEVSQDGWARFSHPKRSICSAALVVFFDFLFFLKPPLSFLKKQQQKNRFLFLPFVPLLPIAFKDQNELSAEQRSGACLLNIFCVPLFDLSLCLPKAAPPLSVPDACFLLLFPPPLLLPLYSTTSDGMPYSIRYAASWRHLSPLSPLYLIILLGTATRALLPKEQQHDASFHLALQVPPHPSASFSSPPQLQLWCNTAPWGEFGHGSLVSLAG